jgi:spore maturation protein CgeB
MKILYAGMRFEHFNPAERHSFEYQNFWRTLSQMPGVAAIEHPFDRILEVGKDRYQQELFEIILREQPDIFFGFMYTDELDPAMLQKIMRETKTKTVAWFADDYWRFFNYGKRWAPYFHYVVTTYAKAVEWYRAAGHTNVLVSQWGCNTADFQPVDTVKDIPVSFIGQRKSGRAAIIDSLRRAGIAVEPFGAGWPNGKLTHDAMLQTVSRSKITLNLTDRKRLWDPSVFGRIIARKSIQRVIPDFHWIDNFRAYLHSAIPHTHARPFELSGCGAFVISGWSEEIEKYYIPDKEIVLYRNPKELAEKITYYLAHDAEREAIARAGFLRTIKEHTYEARFRKLFAEMGVNQ